MTLTDTKSALASFALHEDTRFGIQKIWLTLSEIGAKKGRLNPPPLAKTDEVADLIAEYSGAPAVIRKTEVDGNIETTDLDNLGRCELFVHGLRQGTINSKYPSVYSKDSPGFIGARVPLNAVGGPNNYGFATFKDLAGALTAIKLHDGLIFGSQKISLCMSRDAARKPKGEYVTATLEGSFTNKDTKSSTTNGRSHSDLAPYHAHWPHSSFFLSSSIQSIEFHRILHNSEFLDNTVT